MQSIRAELENGSIKFWPSVLCGAKRGRFRPGWREVVHIVTQCEFWDPKDGYIEFLKGCQVPVRLTAIIFTVTCVTSMITTTATTPGSMKMPPNFIRYFKEKNQAMYKDHGNTVGYSWILSPKKDKVTRQGTQYALSNGISRS